MGKMNYQKAAWKHRHETNLWLEEREKAARKAHKALERKTLKKIAPSISPAVVIPPKYSLGPVIKKILDSK